MKKFYLLCKSCSKSIFDFHLWFANKQSCPGCGAKYAEVMYSNLTRRIITSFAKSDNSFKGMWSYFDILPLKSVKNIISAGEGDVSIDRWSFLEDFAHKHFGINCKVYAHRHDNNNATGSFKDLAGSMVASVLLENNINEYVVASTGNIGVAFSRYISKFDGTLYAFIPHNSPEFKGAEISIFGQRVFRVSGDYTETKKLAEEFANKHNIVMAAGTLDPMRVEAKKTMAYEWVKRLKEFPTVYIQALSGGTGPIGIVKGCGELIRSEVINKMPKLMLVQSNKCSPMADAWKSAKKSEFPSGWQNSYPIYKNPKTAISTLATGNPTSYPILAKMVQESGGDIIDFEEEMVSDIVRVVAYETAVRIGPAAAIAVGGFFKALQKKFITSNDIILINIGEGIRRDPEFMIRLKKEDIKVKIANECLLFNRNKYREEVWTNLKKYINT